MVQKHIVKRGKRTPVHKFFRAKNDEKLVATWRLDLDKICRVFDVRPFPPVQQSLTFSFLVGARSKCGRQHP